MSQEEVDFSTYSNGILVFVYYKYPLAYPPFSLASSRHTQEEQNDKHGEESSY